MMTSYFKLSFFKCENKLEIEKTGAKYRHRLAAALTLLSN